MKATDTQPQYGPWHAASNGTKLRHWFVGRDSTNGHGSQMAEGKQGRRRWFGSYETANRVAKHLNQVTNLDTK